MPLPGIFGRFTGALFGNALGYGIGSAMGPIITPPVQDIGNVLWALHPVRPLDPGFAAQVAIKRPGRFGEMLQETMQSGFNEERFRAIMQAMDNPPGLGEMLELYRRGKIGHAKLEAGLRSALIEAEWLDEVPELARYMLSPGELANMRQQGFISESEQKAQARLQGVEPDDAELQFQIVGLPPGIEMAITLLRRGEITEARFREIVREGHTKTKYTDDILKLQRARLSAETAAEALIRERVDEGRARRIAREDGINDEDFDLMVNMRGRPIAAGTAGQAVNRELVGKKGSAQSRAFFREVVARSNVRTEYADILYDLTEQIPSLFEMRRLIASGAITDAYATELILKRGYPAKLAEGIVNAAHTEKAQATKDLSRSIIEDLYESGFEPREWAMGALVALGYDENEADLLLSMIDARRVISALRSQLNVIHRTYVNHKTTRDTAIGELDSFGIGDVARNLLIESWDAERAANVTRLTNAQIGKAFKKGIIDGPTAIAKWENNGYDNADANVLLRLAGTPDADNNPTGG